MSLSASCVLRRKPNKVATKKQLEQLRKLHEKSNKAENIKDLAAIAGGFTSRNHAQQREAKALLEQTLGKGKASKAIEDVAVQAGAKPKSIVRRILGT